LDFGELVARQRTNSSRRRQLGTPATFGKYPQMYPQRNWISPDCIGLRWIKNNFG
jgi:hypothetical protein